MVDAQQEVGRLNAENKALKTELYELKLVIDRGNPRVNILDPHPYPPIPLPS
jgi:hypothetical protein